MTSPDGGAAAREALARTHREEWARIVAGLARRFRDLDLAEDMASEAFAAALERWPESGVPPNPGGWITTTAHRKAIDRLRREARREAKHEEAFLVTDTAAPAEHAIDDDRLRLIFTCCHPAIALEAQVALTLRIVGGLTVAEIARAFLVQETTMGQRISRAKAKIKAARVPYRVPESQDLPARISGVLTVLYLVFNEGYFASGPGVPPIRRELTGEAIRLTRLVRQLLPGEEEVTGLLALMLLTEARADARLSEDGDLVRLTDQDRTTWDRTLIDEGLALIRAPRTTPGRYVVLAAINAVHAVAPDAGATDWWRIAALYTELERLDPSPIVTLNKAIAISESQSPRAALRIVDGLGQSLDGYHAFHATRAELLRADGQLDEAQGAYDRAIELAGNAAEVGHLRRRRAELVIDPEAPAKRKGTSP